MKQIKVKDEYDEIAEIDAQLSETSGLNAKNKRKKARIDNIHTAFRGIIGFSKLLAVCSIVYSTYIILMNLDGVATKVLLIPQALLAAYYSIDAFVKSNNFKRSKR